MATDSIHPHVREFNFIQLTLDDMEPDKFIYFIGLSSYTGEFPHLLLISIMASFLFGSELFVITKALCK